jgi:hypothetical protein
MISFQPQVSPNETIRLSQNLLQGQTLVTADRIITNLIIKDVSTIVKMGTRGLLGLIIQGKRHGAYNHWGKYLPFLSLL